MPNAQSDYPLTLAEVLFEELEAKDGVMPPSLSNQWLEIKEGIKEIRAATTGSTDSIVAATNVDSLDLNWKHKLEFSSRLVPKIYQLIHKLPEARSALCLSGGGIRSATFNLGVLQGLARNGRLGQFDYLSTVSGGGFIGSWLTAWIYRAGPKAIRELGRPRPVNDQGQPTPLTPEPKPIDNLRVYSNYLTPRKGLLSADTWTLIAVYLRNLFLNWLVFLPAIMVTLMLPRIWAALVFDVETARHPSIYLVVGILGVGAGAVSLFGIMRNLPSIWNKNWRTETILAVVVVPLCLMAMLLCLYWLGIKREPSLANLQLGFRPWEPFLEDSLAVVWHGHKPGWPSFVLIGALIPGGPLLVLSLMHRNAPFAERFASLLLVIAAGGVTGILTYVGVHAELIRRLSALCGVRYDLMFASLAVPSIVIVLLIGGTLVAGFSSRFSKAEDQEWWARCGAWSLIIIIVWLVVSPLVMFGPMFLINLTGLFSGQKLGTTKAVLTTVVGIVSGAITLLGGFSSKTPANKEGESNDFKAKILSLAMGVAAAIFALFIIILLVWLTDWLLFGLARVLRVPLASGVTFLDALRLLPVWLQVVTAGALFVLARITGYLINTNRFSLHYYWRNRIVRAYLGASNPAREDHSNKNKDVNDFTEFAESDGIRMSEIAGSRVKKLYHVINIALNLAGGDKLEWQDRKCESFTVSPLHCGSYWLGYRRSKDYARGSQRNITTNAGTGISLGTAVAISGAAASPNMGYMMTSPIARFLMTLFNVRLGFWLGNPGVRGGPTFERDSPSQSVRPIAAEALGMTNARSPYVYLSDGGHFENLGLYEMVLRRCRLIVVSDASTDPAYAFESLAMAIRQIRVDFGVPIDMQKMSFGCAPEAKHNYCAVGTIRYSSVDKSFDAEVDSAYDGHLVYIKPSLLDDEPRDVLNYHQANPTFPEETIADQWFSESQFESYRMLGDHMIEEICKERGITVTDPLQKFRKQAEAHVKRTPKP